MPPMRAFATVVGLTLLMGGCVSYRASSVDQVAPGAEVRAELTNSGGDRVGDFTVGSDQERVEGALVRTTADSVVLALFRRDLSLGTNVAPGRVEVPFTRDEILQIEEKDVSPARTAALVVGLTAGIYLIAEGVFDGFGGGDSGGGGGPDITLLPSGTASSVAGWILRGVLAPFGGAP